MPSFNELKARRYSVSVGSSTGEEFLSPHEIYFRHESFGHLLVKTDQPIYKPSQTGTVYVQWVETVYIILWSLVRFCVIHIDSKLQSFRYIVVYDFFSSITTCRLKSLWGWVTLINRPTSATIGIMYILYWYSSLIVNLEDYQSW